MDLKARHKLIDDLLAKLGSDLLGLAEQAPEHWAREEFEWLMAHCAQGMTNDRVELGLRRKSFKNTVRRNHW